MSSLNLDSHNVVTAEELIEIVTTSAKTLIANPDMADQLPALLVRGAAGLGKSTIVKDIAKSLNIGFIDVRLAQMDRCDICGIPSVEKNMTKWNIPSIWPSDPDSAGILFFDEITAAPSDVQVAAYSIILDRAIPNTDYKIPAKWLIVAAGNRSIDKAVVKPMSSALANRFAHFTLDVDPESWNNWAVAHDIHPSVTGFIRFRPQHLLENDSKTQNLEMGWPSPRSWEKVSNTIPLFGNNEAVLRKVVYGLVGPSAGIEFIEFHKLSKKMVDVEEWLSNDKAKIELPKKADEMYAVCSAIPYLLWNGKTEAEQKKRVSNFYKIVTKLPNAYAMMVTKSIFQGTKRMPKIQAIRYIMSAKEYKDFVKKFGTEMTKKYEI